jgi:hypothetical protein
MAEAHVEVEQHEDEVDEVLAVLRDLIGRAPSPIIRACLEDACADIAHLTGRDGPPGRPEEDTTAA